MATGGRCWGVVIVAAGSGDRFGDPQKVLCKVRGIPLLLHSVRTFHSIPAVEHIVVVLGEHTLGAGSDALQEICATGRLSVVVGGATREASVREGLNAMPDSIDFIAVHDAARPLVSPGLVEAVFEAAERTGAAVPALPVTDTLISVDSTQRKYAGTVDRNRVRAAQTPQAARRDWIESALAANQGATDEGSALARAGYPVELVPGDPRNVKVTWPDDISLVEALLGRSCEA